MNNCSLESTNISIEPGFRSEHRKLAAKGYWNAFSRKLNWPLGPENKALSFLQNNLDPTHAISAISSKGDFLGVAGFKTPKGAFVGGTFQDLVKNYGWFGALRRAALLSVLERDCEADTLLMDGIFVEPTARGKGIGGRLLCAIEAHAQSLHLNHVRLDVIDSNTRARALYERQGYVQTGEQSLGFLKHIFGFERAATMVKTLT